MHQKLNGWFSFRGTLCSLVMLFSAWGNPAASEEEKIVLQFWVSDLSPRTKGFQRSLREYERRNPQVQIKIQLIPMLGQEGVMDAQKLMCGVAGGAPPDLIEQDRFSIGDWASRGAFMALDELIAESLQTDNPIRKEDYYEACWNEAVYEGKVYGIPNRTDSRALYYNKDILERYGLVDEKGDARPPKDWDELREYTRIMTKRDANGHIVECGFLPLWGNSWLYLYGWQNGGSFMSPDGRTCTLNDPKIVEALEYMTELYDMIGGRNEADAYEKTFQMEAQDAFLLGQIALRISEDPQLGIIAQYKPDLRFGVAPPPSPKGKPIVTWSGGFCYAIPNGSRHPEASWKLIRFLVSEEGVRYQNRSQQAYNRSRGKPFVPTIPANKKIAQMVVNEFAPQEPNLRQGFQMFVDLMPYSKFRPVTPVGQLLWDNHVKAAEEAVRHIRTPQQSLDYWTANVQQRLDQIFTEKQYKEVDWKLLGLILIGVLAIVAIGVAIHYKRHPISLARRKETLAALGFIALWLIGFIFFLGGPILASIVLSFCEFDVLHPAKFVGFANYYEMLFQDTIFWKSLYNTIYMTISVPLSLVLGLGMALLVNQEVRGTAVFRTLFYLPAIVPVVASSMVWLWLLNPRLGVINIVLMSMGVDNPPSWIADVYWSKPSIVLMLVWGSGASMVIWLAGLKGIPTHLYEAATIDGADHWGQFWNVTLPMLSPYVFFNLIMGIIGIFQVFAQAYVMTNGGPADSTLFFVYYLFNQAYKYLRMGYASAMAWILFLIVLGLTVLNLKLAPHWVHYEGERN